ncbi:protein transport protein Sec16B-like isoform X2 [Rhinatrema bivittatum]|uniref:protein transport protein Sec16B-like isoform X2 n=1 Tax=Rhinatrema bivittatum TaxID=194408 RepID=UPI00112E55F0|nr:protein transport protein Sec16B-like isoform X2 [Rhinatrema bivittatum]
MDPRGPLPRPQHQGRYLAGAEALEQGPWMDGYHHRSTPHPRPNSDRYYQPLDPRYGPRPWLNPWAKYYHPHPDLSFRANEQSKLESWAEYYERGYLHRPYSRQGYEEAYQTYTAPGSGGYPCYPRAAQEEQDWGQGGRYDGQMVYWDQSYYGKYQQEPETGSFQQRNGARYKTESYEESYVWNSRQERDGEDLQRSSGEKAAARPDEFSAPSEPSLLLQYRESGLSSSSYELSQYMVDSSDQYDQAPSGSWSPSPAGEVLSSTPQPVAPLKYALPHVAVCFGAGGQLVRVCPNFPAEGQPALVEIHSLEVLLHDTAEQEEMRAFPGPLAREDLHKMDVMTYCQRKVALIRQSESTRSRDSALLWKLLILLCRQNGTMDGSDIAELLMQDCKRMKYLKQEAAANLINLTDEAWLVPGSGTPDLLTGEIPYSSETATMALEKFTKLLFYGRKKEALEWAMKSQLWGHALFLSSKMDLRTYSEVMGRFTSTLAVNDPVQTLFQLMSGRVPRAATCSGDTKWGDWRPHLAVILANQVEDTELKQRAIVAMGDSLAGKGLIEAAHCCYLMANVAFGHYNVRTHSLILLGSSHSQTFLKFTSTESIQRTEIFEFCRQLGLPKSFIPPFQVYKLLYASRLADYGLPSQALHYCEVIGSALQDQASVGHPVLFAELLKLAERLKLSDPRLSERPEQEQHQDPDWLTWLRVRCQHLQVEGDHDSPTAASAHTASASSPAAVQFQAFSESRVNLEDSRKDTQTQQNRDNLGHSQYTHYTAEGMGQYQIDTAQHLSYHPGTYHMAGVPQQVPVPIARVRNTFQPGFNEAVQSAGSPENDCSPPAFLRPGEFAGTAQPQTPYKQFGDGKETPALQDQRMLNPRMRSISESSTISVEEEQSEDSNERGIEDMRESPQAQEMNEAKGKESATGSGFGWFGWFRSKPAKTTASDSSLPEPQEKVAAPSLPPLALTSPSSRLPAPPPPPPPALLLPRTGANPFSRTAGTKEPQGSDSRRTSLSESPSSPSPAFAPLPLGGAVPLFNPLQLTIARSSAPNHPRMLSQRRYPTQPK